jgi:hypothetical protein
MRRLSWENGVKVQGGAPITFACRLKQKDPVY